MAQIMLAVGIGTSGNPVNLYTAEDFHRASGRSIELEKLRVIFRRRRGYRLLAITGDIVDTRVPTIFFFGSLTLLNLIVSTLFR